MTCDGMKQQKAISVLFKTSQVWVWGSVAGSPIVVEFSFFTPSWLSGRFRAPAIGCIQEAVNWRHFPHLEACHAPVVWLTQLLPSCQIFFWLLRYASDRLT